MRAACSAAESLIAIRATSAGVPMGLHAAKLRIRAETPHEHSCRVIHVVLLTSRS
jgi:hypothetical protein